VKCGEGVSIPMLKVDLATTIENIKKVCVMVLSRVISAIGV
jgi:hypothetical protein